MMWAVLGMAAWILLATQGAWAGETSTTTATFTGGIISGAVTAETHSLAEQIVNHLSNANTDDDAQNGGDDISVIAANGPLASFSVVIEFDNPDTNILSPFSNIGTFSSALTNTISLNTDFAGITTFQQSAGLANATSNLVVAIDGDALDTLLRELFGPDDTLLETTASSFVGNTGHNAGVVGEDDDSVATAGGKKIAGGATASSRTETFLTRLFDVTTLGGGFGEGSNPVTTILSPHSNVIHADGANDLITLNTKFAGLTTFQQQAGGASAQSNFVVLLYSSPERDVLALDQDALAASGFAP